jgi:hypothetical protein
LSFWSGVCNAGTGPVFLRDLPPTNETTQHPDDKRGAMLLTFSFSAGHVVMLVEFLPT